MLGNHIDKYLTHSQRATFVRRVGITLLALTAVGAVALLPRSVHADPVSTRTSIVDDSAPGWIWSQMDEFDDPALHGGSGHAGRPGGSGAYAFHGPGVVVYGMCGPRIEVDHRSHKLGKARLSIDGKVRDTISLERTDREYNFLIDNISGLGDANHVLEVAAEGGWIVIDYIKVQTTDAGTVDGADANIPSMIPAGDYLLIPRHAPDKRLALVGSPINGAQAQIFGPSDNQFEVWHIAPEANGLYRVSPRDAQNEVLCLRPTSAVDRAPRVFLWRDLADSTQRLMFTPCGDGFYRIAPSVNPNDVMDVGAIGKTDGTPVVVFGWWGALNQQWWLTKVEKHD